MTEFTTFPSIPRLFREMVITEKIDGTNAQINVLEDGTVLAGSRSRYITPEDDNFGFARWVREHEEQLREGLRIGQHFGEWWGSSIQRGYGLEKGDKRFSLFNVKRWWSMQNEGAGMAYDAALIPPECCSVVPVVYVGPFNTDTVNYSLATLSMTGSIAAQGFMKPEGIVVFHKASGHLFKYTLDKNDGHKG